MFENPRRGRQRRNFTTNVPKILDRKSSSEQIFSENCRWVPLFNLVDALRTSSSVIGSSRIDSFDFANSANLDTLKSTNFSNPLFAELLGGREFSKIGYPFFCINFV